MSEYAWLIEAPGQRYLGTRRLGRDEFFWTQDHHAATRFMSEAQADGVMMAVREANPDLFAFARNIGDARPTEHAWLLSPPAEAKLSSLTTEGRDGGATEVLVETEELIEVARQAYLAGCCAVLTWTHSGMPQDDLDEASYDYVASLDFTENTRPFRSSPSPDRGGWRPIESAPRDGTHVILAFGRDGVMEGWWDDNDPGPYPWKFVDRGAPGSTGYAAGGFINGSREVRGGPTHWQPLLPPLQEEGEPK